MEAFMARAAGEKPPGMGYMGCPGLRKTQDGLSVELRLFTLPECGLYSQPSQRVRELSHPWGGDGVTGGVGAPGDTCSTSGLGLGLVGFSWSEHIYRKTDGDRQRKVDSCAVYPSQLRNQERPAVERRPPGCRTAVGGGGSCEGAAPSAHCLTADRTRWLMKRGKFSCLQSCKNSGQRLIFRQATLQRKSCILVSVRVNLRGCVENRPSKGTHHKL